MTNPVRPLAVLTGSLFAVTASIDIPHDQATEFGSVADYALEACFSAALIVASFVLWSCLRTAKGRAARTGWLLSLLGTAVLAIVVTATLLNGGETLDTLFSVGFLAMLLGYAVLLVADLAKWVSPRYAGVVLALSAIAMIALGDGHGVIAWSAGWFAFAALTPPVASVTIRDEATSGTRR